jgi:Lon protease-like protein
MIDLCLRENKPFGVLLIRDGHEVGGPAITYRMGTSAYITQAETLPDGRINILSVGYQRFSLREIREDRPYQVGIVEDTPLPLGDEPQVKTLAKELSQDLQRFLTLLHTSGGKHLELDTIPEDGHALAYLVAIILALRLEEKQRLLEASDVQSMLIMQRRFVRRELGFLRYGLGQDEATNTTPSIFMN